MVGGEGLKVGHYQLTQRTLWTLLPPVDIYPLSLLIIIM